MLIQQCIEDQCGGSAMLLELARAVIERDTFAIERIKRDDSNMTHCRRLCEKALQAIEQQQQ